MHPQKRPDEYANRLYQCYTRDASRQLHATYGEAVWRNQAIDPCYGRIQALQLASAVFDFLCSV